MQAGNSELRLGLEDLEQFIMGTSETINEKIEEIQTQMSDLIIEVKSNVDLVEDKRSNNAKDTK